MARRGLWGLGLVAVPLLAGAQPTDAIGAGERAAIFKAAGAVQRGDAWVICAEDPRGDGASIDQVRDLNGDGRLEAVVSEAGTFCYGAAGTGFQLVGKQADGSWKHITGDNGIPEFLESRGTDGWPDISIGGPGFCFPVQRWNGKEYSVDRHEYEGKPCKPG